MAKGRPWPLAAGRPMLDKLPEGVHDRSPIYLGSTKNVARMVELLEEEGLAA
jgi:fructose-1,6-bisphosphatase